MNTATALTALDSNAPAHSTWSNADFAVGVDPHGRIVSIAHPADAHAMNWVSTTSPLPWGVPMIRDGGRLTAWPAPVVEAASDRGNTLRFVRSMIIQHLELRLEQTLDGGRLTQRYTLTNAMKEPLQFGEADFGIRVPFADNYPGAATCLVRRCNAHLWAGGRSAWACALRMGGAGPHLGLVTTHGAFTAYSITDRPWHSNDRGTFVLHPGAITLAPGASTSFGWTLFWHTGWDDFFAQAARVPGFVRMQADRYTASRGEPIRITATSDAPLADASLTLNGKPLDVARKADGDTLTFEHAPAEFGEQVFELTTPGGRTHLRAFVSPPPLELIEARVRFLIEHQQRRAPGEPTNDAFLTFDTETREQIYQTRNDQNAGRERVGMGVLLALYLPHCRDAALAARVRESLDRYYRYVTTQLQDAEGTVFNDAGSRHWERLYNFPWVARLHLSMYAADPQPRYLDAYVRTIRRYYALGGREYYAIGLPIADGLATLKAAGRADEHAALLALFRGHADRIIEIGHDMPAFEFVYEQSIVAPVCEVIAQVHLATGDRRYLDALGTFLPALLAFNGEQPDHHLHDVAIRHWDGYWFGKRQLYGDTFPHYWSTITGRVLADLARAVPERAAEYRARALDVVTNNFSLFAPDGSASCAHLYPLAVNDRPGQFNDPWANDQDWALAHYLLIVR